LWLIAELPQVDQVRLRRTRAHKPHYELRTIFGDPVPKAFPDWRSELPHLIAEDDLVAEHFTARGMPQGSVMGESPTAPRCSCTVCRSSESPTERSSSGGACWTSSASSSNLASTPHSRLATASGPVQQPLTAGRRVYRSLVVDRAVREDDGAEFDALIISRGLPRRETALQRMGRILSEFQDAA
jgi:hypothetical protein